MRFFLKVKFFFLKHLVFFLSVLILFSALYLGVIKFWYFGTVDFFLSQPNTKITIEKRGNIICETLSCSKQLPPGKYFFAVEKEGFDTFTGSFTILFQKNTEIKVSLQKNSLQLTQEGSEKNTKKNLFYSFSDKNSQISLQELAKNYPKGFSIVSDKENENPVLQWNNSLVFSLSSASLDPFYISSDEVGRGYFFITPKEIKLFTPSSQNISTQVKTSLSEVIILSDGSFLFKSQGEYFWKSIGKPLQKMPENFSPFSLSAVCKSDQYFIFLQSAYTFNEGEILQIDYTNNFEQKKIGTLENFSFTTFDSLQCVSSNTIRIFFTDTNPVSIQY